MQDDVVLSVEHVAQRVGVRRLYGDVSFSVRQGEIVCLLGNNGAGKSTLFRSCCGLLPPTEGKICLAGNDIVHTSEADRARLVAWCPQSLERAPGFSGWQFVALAKERARFLEGRSRATPQEKEWLEECLRRFDADAIVDREITVLSGGEWKRLQLARAWAQGSRLVVLDEPSTGLDLRHVRLLSQRMRELAASQGTAVLLSTHDLSLALAASDRLVFLHEGRVVADASRASLVGSAVFDEVFGVKFTWNGEDISCNFQT